MTDPYPRPAMPETAPERWIIRRTALGDVPTRAARRNPAAIALVDGAERISHGEFEAQANQFAHHLLQSGLRPGDKVAMLALNSIEFLVATFGIFKAGMVWVPVNYMLGESDVRFVLEHAEAARVLIDTGLLQRDELRRALEATGLPVLELKPGRGADADTPLRQASAGMPDSPPDVDLRDQDLALIMYTSGTTGRQKGVMHSHASVHSACMSNVAESKLDLHAVMSCALPLFHCAQFSGAVAALIAGACTVLLRGFDAGAFLDTLEQRRITHCSALPMMYGAMLAEQKRQPRDLSALVQCSYGMAPMARPMLEQLVAHFCPSFSLGSGQTEVFPVTTRFRPEQQLQRFGSYWGTATLVNDLAVMDGEGRLLPHGEIGEIVHRGPNVMIGYYKDPEATAAVSRFGWHHTGDIGRFDEDGQLLFLDRTKDLIKSGGENVPSIKVEEAFLRHPAVANAAAVGIAHPRWGEAVTVFVLLRDGADATEQALLEHGRAMLPGFEAPKEVRILQDFPMTPTGKIQKHKLRTQFAQLYAQPAHGG
ncbi:AMP-dependent synthetase [Melaminivora suipulveris]|uniref:AMP-dependent synthetase n=1 Tax=Melaminivora suipulveris TaxID=2109913 RepID=A0A2R3QBP9_9BURK|nr:AMP-binding protein [Melaminivora suipulveris]AVO49213.1 AMP-dependent synthetase [Melaminivora suipulveris]